MGLKVINWALKQTKEDKLGSKLMKNIEQWLAGTKNPASNIKAVKLKLRILQNTFK